jgi:hypothetical protein
MSWVEDEAKEIKQQNERKHEERDWALHKSRLLAERRFEIWTAILEQIKKDVAVFNRLFEADQRAQIEIYEAPAHSVTLVKNFHPSVTVTTQIQGSGRTIRLTVRKVHDPLGVPVEKSDAIMVDMDERENVEFSRSGERLSSVDDISQSVLPPILDAYRQAGAR